MVGRRTHTIQFTATQETTSSEDWTTEHNEAGLKDTTRTKYCYTGGACGTHMENRYRRQGIPRIGERDSTLLLAVASLSDEESEARHLNSHDVGALWDSGSESRVVVLQRAASARGSQRMASSARCVILGALRTDHPVQLTICAANLPQTEILRRHVACTGNHSPQDQQRRHHRDHAVHGASIVPQRTMIGREHSQGRQGRNPKLGREQPGDER